MKEEQIQNLIREHGENMPEFNPVYKGKRSASPTRWAWLAVPVAVGAVVVFITTPSAEARAFGAMKSALTDVKTMHAITSISRSNGKRWQFGHTWFKDGIWRTEGFLKTPLHKAWIFDDTRQYTIDIARKSSTTEPRAIGWFDSKTALEYVIEQTDTGPMGLNRRVKRTSGPVENGHETYRLEFFKERTEGFGENSRAVIAVDAVTNLPLWSEVSTQLAGTRDSHERTDYEFNIPISPEVFQPDFLPVLNLVEEQSALMKKWKEHPLARTEKIEILDAQINEDGELFLLFSGSMVPISATSNDGTVYVRATDIRPGGTRGDTGTQKRTEGVKGAVFVPAFVKPATSPIFRIAIGDRYFETPGRSYPVPMPPEANRGEVDIIARRCNLWPDYQNSLILADSFSWAWPEMASRQGRALAQKGDIDGAVARYKIAYDRARKFTKMLAYRQLWPAEKLLRENGRVKEADAMAKQLTEERAKDVNVPLQTLPRP